MRLISKAAATIAVPLLVTACAAAPPAAPAQHPRPTATPAAADPDAGLLTGAELKSMLAPGSWFPAGFTADPTGSVNTGSSYQQPSPAAAGAPDCQRLDGTAWVVLGGVGSVSFAQDDYIDQSTSEQYAQEIDVFTGTGAQQVMTGLRNLSHTCPSFQDQQTSSTVSVKLRKGPRLGEDALTFLLDSPRWQGGTALEAVRIGSAVITVLYSADSGTGRAQATRLASAIAAKLAPRA
jgi:hypothetical protein